MFFFNDTATTEIYTLSLHDALPISSARRTVTGRSSRTPTRWTSRASLTSTSRSGRASTSVWARRWHAWRRRSLLTHRSEEHTSELQSRQYLVCRLLLEKKYGQ